MLDLDGRMPTSRRCESITVGGRYNYCVCTMDAVCKTPNLNSGVADHYMSRGCEITHSEFIFVDRPVFEDPFDGQECCRKYRSILRGNARSL
jgi:hypothetical protein